MSRLASWRRAPGEPDTARRWLFQWREGVEKRVIDRREIARSLGILAAILTVAGLVCLAAPEAQHFMAPVVVGAANFVFSGTKPRERPFPKDPPEVGEAFRVGITILDVRGLRTGSDQGWLIFSEGWILFEGERTEFAVTRGESYRRHREAAHGLKLEDGRTVVLTPVGKPLVPKRLDRAFLAWETASIPEGEAVLPPREIHPEIWAERHSRWAYGTVATMGIAVFGATLALWPLTALSIALLTFCVGNVVECGRRLRKALPCALSAGSSSRDLAKKNL